MSQFQPTTDLPGELISDYEEVMQQIASEKAPQESPLDSDDPWPHIWVPEDPKMPNSERVIEANNKGFLYFLGHNGIIHQILDEFGFRWIGVMNIKWLKTPQKLEPSAQ